MVFVKSSFCSGFISILLTGGSLGSLLMSILGSPLGSILSLGSVLGSLLSGLPWGEVDCSYCWISVWNSGLSYLFSNSLLSGGLGRPASSDILYSDLNCSAVIFSLRDL